MERIGRSPFGRCGAVLPIDRVDPIPSAFCVGDCAGTIAARGPQGDRGALCRSVMYRDAVIAARP
ncbi:MAG TPA: hypothetical protein HPP77_07665 [Candidatus Hydrogenedentes bacterium]|nr:hypothetical protein [Candidatus Hydrogenedentota bacterium]HIJ72550.1 hypothetical protein [Candidatus Hydrogenedentota bacterium]